MGRDSAYSTTAGAALSAFVSVSAAFSSVSCMNAAPALCITAVRGTTGAGAKPEQTPSIAETSATL
tara:strand:+ start:430 stop:627 length:198 start_codon:yes stop_codon:yes gene_type:complete